MTTYVYSFDDPKRLVSSVRVTIGPLHANLTVWNRGAQAGEITVISEDATLMLARLLGCHIGDIPQPTEVMT